MKEKEGGVVTGFPGEVIEEIGIMENPEKVKEIKQSLLETKTLAGEIKDMELTPENIQKISGKIKILGSTLIVLGMGWAGTAVYKINALFENSQWISNFPSEKMAFLALGALFVSALSGVILAITGAIKFLPEPPATAK